ncbi:11700_t:CDS:2, partial [Funneliformis mosseae]
QQPNKKQNTLQTTEPDSSVFTINNNKETPVIMDVDPLLLDKEKGKEVLTGKIQLSQSTTCLLLFPSADDYEVAISNDNLTINSKHVE